MFKAVAVSMFLAFGVLTVGAQKVEVTQGFVDDATKAFREVVVLREALKASNEAREASKREAEAERKYSLLLEKTVANRDEIIENYRKIKCDKTSYLFGLIKSTRCN